MNAMTKKKGVIVEMMGHGKHHDCAMCKMAKAVGMVEKCTDVNCTNPGHKKRDMEKGDKNEQK